MSQNPAPVRVDNITVHWNPADHSFHSEADFLYDGYTNPVHNVIDLTGWQFDYFVGELAKLQSAYLVPGTDPETTAKNVALVQHDYWWGKAMPRPQLPATPPIDTTAPDLTA